MKHLSVFLLFLIAFCLSFCNDSVQTQPSESNPYEFSSGVSSIPTDSQTVENLVVLGRVWGFLKYHHPVVASGKYNWDYELFKMMPKIIAAKSPDERNDLLVKWIDSLGTFEQQDSVRVIDSANVKMWPDYSWMKEEVLGELLVEKLELVRTAKRNKKSWYVGLYPKEKSLYFLHENGYEHLQFPDAGYRMLCLFRYWNIIEYYFPYKYLTDRPWENVLAEYVPKFINCKSEIDYELCVKRLTGEIDDSHAAVSKTNSFRDYRGHYNPLVKLSLVEGKAVVMGFMGAESEKSSGLKRGDVIISVDGITVDSIYRSRRINISASNDAAAWRDICTGIMTSKDSIVHVEYERNGAINQTDMRCYRDTFPSFTKYYGTDSAICDAAPGIACIFPGLLTIDKLATSLDNIRLAKGIIIDYRCYPNEMIIDTLSDFLFPHPVSFAKMTYCTFTTPGLFRFTDDELQGRENPQHYRGKIVIIVNERTQSEAEFNTMALRIAPQAIVLGSRTAGADGNAAYIDLPGGIKTLISGTGIYYPDGRETQRVGIIPDIEVHPTIQGIREGRDELMEAAIEHINR